MPPRTTDPLSDVRNLWLWSILSADQGGRESRLPGERWQPREAYISQAHQSGDHRAWVSAAAQGSSSRVVGISLQWFLDGSEDLLLVRHPLVHDC